MQKDKEFTCLPLLHYQANISSDREIEMCLLTIPGSNDEV
jgi:hypothetical protein